MDILTAKTNKDEWIEETKKDLESEERKNCTFKPKINKKYRPNGNPDESQRSETSYGLNETTGDKCFDLYQLSLLKRKEKKDQTSEDYQFEKEKEELTFQPNLTKKSGKSAVKKHKINH